MKNLIDSFSYLNVMAMHMRNSRGFTLVELMVVVAIIGILSSVALPNFKRYQAKSKTSEAKLQLAAIYTAQTSFYADFDTYASCLVAMGYDPTADSLQRYYATGVNVTLTAGAIASGSVSCGVAASGGSSMFQAAKLVQGGATTQLVVAGGALTGAAFSMMAGGIISNTTTIDTWSITQRKVLVNTITGY